MASCIYKPTVVKDGQEVDSKLFNDLMQFTGNRETTKYLWGLSKVKEFVDTLENIEYDENGEVTLDSLDRAMDLEKLLKSNTTLIREKRAIGAIDKNDNPIKYDKSSDIIDKVMSFNKANPNLVASINRDGGDFVIDVARKTVHNQDIPTDIMFSNSLNNELRAIMRSLGFDVEVKEGLTYEGIFDPLNGKETAEKLRTVILVAEGEIGELAFPEEFSHFIIEGLLNEPFVKRVLNTLNDIEVIKEVLGEDFDTYNDLYKGDMFMLQKEAAGKLLHGHIIKQENAPRTTSLVGRLWNWAKNKFKLIGMSSIDRAIDRANLNMERVATSILDGSIIPLFNKEMLQDSKPLYRVAKKVVTFEDTVQKSLEFYSKRIKILQSRSKRGKYKKSDVLTIKQMLNLIEKKEYAKSTIKFLGESLTEIQKLHKKINSLVDNQGESDTSLTRIGAVSKTLLNIDEFSQAYESILKSLSTVSSLKRDPDVTLTDEDAALIEDASSEILKIINTINNTYEELRFNTVWNFLSKYWGEDKIQSLTGDGTDKITLEMILTTAYKDINGLDRWISSLSDASDPLLSLVDKVVKVSLGKRDRILENLLLDIRAAHVDLIKAGYNTDFMFEIDPDHNKFSGRIISDIDFHRFYKERREFIKGLKQQGLTSFEIQPKLEAWEKRRTVTIVIDKETGRKETIPSYKKDVLSKLSAPQRAYYDAMLNLKIKMDSLLPERQARTYNAILIRNDMFEGLIDNIGDPLKVSKIIAGALKDKFLVRSDNDNYGRSVIDPLEFEEWVIDNDISINTPEEIKKAEKQFRKYVTNNRKFVMEDFSGKIVEKLPVYYTQRLEDMDRLSTDFTSSLLAYASMAVNYSEMNKIIDVMELTRDLIKDRDVQQRLGNKVMTEAYKAIGKVYQKSHVKKGSESLIGQRLDDYYASVFYGKKKKDLGSMQLFGQEVSLAQTSDVLKEYTTQTGLGLNVFSALSNVTIGNIQLFIEGVGGEYYNLKDSAIAKKNYYALLPQYMGELHSVTKNSVLGLLIDKFDALESFSNDLKSKDFYKNPLARIMGDTNLLFLNSAGEHYLHSRNMLAMLNATKVMDNSGKEVSVFNAYTTVRETSEKGNNIGSVLVFKTGTKTEGGKALFDVAMYEETKRLLKKNNLTEAESNRLVELREIKEFTDDYTNALKLRINKVAQSLNGAFNDIDKGALHRGALGRLAMQFKQWMPAHYYRRFARPYYDAQLDQYREGYYQTMLKFSWNLMKDIKRAEFQLGTRWHSLTNHQKANIKKSLAEISVFAMLSGLIALIGPEKERKGVWSMRMIAYTAKRLKLEVSASMPFHPAILDNLMTIIQSPAAAIKSFNNITSLVQFWNIFNEIQSGRYKGWSEYTRDALLATPYLPQLMKVRDITEEDYMFTLFN